MSFSNRMLQIHIEDATRTAFIKGKPRSRYWSEYAFGLITGIFFTWVFYQVIL